MSILDFFSNLFGGGDPFGGHNPDDLEMFWRIEHELENNIALEIAEPERDDFDEPINREDAPDADSDSFEHLDDMTSDVPDIAENEFDSSARVSDRYEDDSYRTASRLDGEPDAKSSAMANAPARTGTLQDQLLDQWRLTELDEDIIAAGIELIGYLDDDGFLRTSFDDIIQRASPALGLTADLLGARVLGRVEAGP